MTKKSKLLLGIIAGVLVIIFFISRPPSAVKFKSDDATGYAACEAFERAEGSGGKYYHNAIGMAADYGSKAKSERLHDSVDSQRAGLPVIPDLSDFKRACKKSGYRF